MDSDFGYLSSILVVDELLEAAQSPISNLPYDILWTIFSIGVTPSDSNTNEENHGPAPLLTLLRTSQVCSRWRQLILASPSLWGSAVDFDLLRKDEWREEVLRRTGDAMLCITGFCGGSYDRYLDAHIGLSILCENWSRVQYIDISFVSVKERHESFKDQLFQLICRPAYTLEEFRLSFPSRLQDELDGAQSVLLLPPSGFTLFDDKAPALFAFNAPNIKIDLKAPWISQLQDLSLNQPTPVNDLLRLLGSMPSLKRLNLDGDPYALADIGGSDPSLQQISLPSLEQITITVAEGFAPHLTFLRHLQTPLECCFLLDIFIEFTIGEEVASAHEFLDFYWRRCGSDTIEDTHIRLQNTSLHLELRNIFRAQSESKFSLVVSHLPGELTQYINSVSSVIPLHIRQKTNRLSIRGHDLTASFKIAASDLISLFPNIEVLDLLPPFINEILKLPPGVLVPMFPKLTAVKLVHPKDRHDIKSITAFIALRILSGKPLQRLVVTSTVCPFLPVNRKLLREFPFFNGLEIVSRIYDCDGCVQR